MLPPPWLLGENDDNAADGNYDDDGDDGDAGDGDDGDDDDDGDDGDGGGDDDDDATSFLMTNVGTLTRS